MERVQQLVLLSFCNNSTEFDVSYLILILLYTCKTLYYIQLRLKRDQLRSKRDRSISNPIAADGVALS